MITTIEFMCFNPDSAIFPTNAKPQKLVNRLIVIYLGSSISSSESDVNILHWQGMDSYW